MNAYYYTYGSTQLSAGTFNDDFHVFGLYWDETGMVSFADDPGHNEILHPTIAGLMVSTRAAIFRRRHLSKGFARVSGAALRAVFTARVASARHLGVHGLSPSATEAAPVVRALWHRSRAERRFPLPR